jgi:hypothetical protein
VTSRVGVSRVGAQRAYQLRAAPRR